MNAGHTINMWWWIHIALEPMYLLNQLVIFNYRYIAVYQKPNEKKQHGRSFWKMPWPLPEASWEFFFALSVRKEHSREQKPKLGLVRLETWPQELALKLADSARKLPRLGGDSQEVAWPVLRGKEAWWSQEGLTPTFLPDQLNKYGKDLGKCQRGG